jgi:hypothetical protein
MRKTRRSMGRNTEFYVNELTPAADKATKFHTGEELATNQRENFRSLLYDDFPELLQPMDSPHVSRQWDHPIDTSGPMKRQRLNILRHAERVELNRQLKDVVDVGLIRPSYITRKDDYPIPRVDDTLDELKDANFYTHLDLVFGFW